MKSVRNLSDVNVLFVDQLNAYDVLRSDDLVFTPTALDAFIAGEERRRPGGLRVSAIDYKDPRDVILRPVVSEKSYGLIDEGKYTFLVDPRANKTEIKLAIEKIFGVQVKSVTTANRTGKTRRTQLRHRQAQGHQARHRLAEVGHHRHLHGRRLIGPEGNTWLFATTSRPLPVVAAPPSPTSRRSRARRPRRACCARCRRPVAATRRAGSRPVTSVVATSASTA